MPHFSYRAIDKNSHVTQGILVAESESSLERRVESLGLWLIEAKATIPKRRLAGSVTVKRKDLVDFFSGLATLVGAGIDVSESLKVLITESSHEDFRLVLEDLRLNVESGVSLCDAMSAHPETFDLQVVNLVRAGEYSGQLTESCLDISRHVEWLDQLVGDVKQATMYPAMVSVAVLGLIFLMFGFVVPRFSVIFDGLNLELPTITKVVVAIGEFCSNYWWAFPLVLGGVFAMLRYGPKYSPAFGYSLDRLKLKLPIFGPLVQLLVLSRFSHNMSLLAKAGVPIVDALDLVRGIVGSRVMGAAVTDASMAVTEGRTMSSAFAAHAIVSPIVLRMIVVGEETGRLDDCLLQISVRLDDEIPRRIKRVFGVLEPLIILFLLGVVGMVAASIFMPLFSLMNGIR